MRKLIVLCLLSFSAAVLCPIQANVVTGVAAVPDGYYNGVDGKTNPDNILDALRAIIDNHTVISYAGLEPYYEMTDFYADTLWDMYSTCRFYMSDANVPQKAVCDGWNKEHVCCQSWLGSGPMVSDLFNVYPTDARVNNIRSNYPYGEVSGANGTGISKDPDHHAMGKKGSNTFPGYSGIAFEPHDDYKGDFARTFMYMVARYRENILNASVEGKVMFVSGKTNFTDYAKNLLMKWHRADPVSQKEIDRNQAVYDSIQHNRNPFIDYPELAEYIWGNRVGQAINLSSMTPTCEGGGYDPGQVTKYGVAWSVNGDILYVDSVIAGRAILALPDAPEPCSALSETFVGWTTAAIEDSTDQAPELLKTMADFPVVTGDRTYYAVFAHVQAGEQVEPAVYTYDDDHQDGWTNTASKDGRAYWLLDQGKVLTSPTVNLAGLSSIQVNMRTYGGTSNCNLDVKAGETQIATIVATSGSALTDYTWTNTGILSGESPLTFSTNYGANKGIGFTSVVINATGAGTTYSRFITQCGEIPQDLEKNGQLQMTNYKFFRDGQLLIQLNGKTYNALGAEVK